MSDQILSRFFADLAQLFAGESRPGGALAAQVLTEHAAQTPALPASPPAIDLSALNQLTRERKHPCLPDIQTVLPRLDWHYSGLSDGRIREDIARHMLTVELIGPTGMFAQSDIRIGLFFQSAALNYVTREHAAEETFIMLAGQAFWSCNDDELISRSVGDIIHHPSMAPHKSVTDKSPLLALWRWTGDIAYEKYKLTG